MEIERKYLVSGAPPQGAEVPVQLVQGYVAIDSETEVRVRVAGGDAFLAVKTFRKPGSISRHELARRALFESQPRDPAALEPGRGRRARRAAVLRAEYLQTRGGSIC